MTMIETGIYGAKVQSWREANPRAILKRVIEASPRADQDQWLAEFWQQVEGDEAMIETIIRYWFALNFRSLVKPDKATIAARRVAARAATAAVQGKVTQEIERKARLMLLDLTMPNGKPLRHCTGKDCAKFAGWHGKIAKMIKPNQKVGDALSETQLRKLAKS